MASWYYQVGGQTIGPVDESVIKQWVADGKFGTDLRVRKERERGWRTVGEYPELAGGGQCAVATQTIRGGLAGSGMELMVTDGTRPLARITQAQCAVFCDPSGKSVEIGTLDGNDVIELRRLWKWQNGWIEIRLSGDRGGYIRDTTPLTPIHRVITDQPDVLVCLDSADDAEPIVTLSQGAWFWMLGTKQVGMESRVYVQLPNGQVGYIAGNTSIRLLPLLKVETMKTGHRHITVGGFWLFGGILVTTVTRLMATGSYILCWGAMLFGGIQFAYGLSQSTSCAVAPRYKTWDL